MSDLSIAQWLDDLQRGDEAAANQLWQEYFERLTSLARNKLRASPKRMADEEDVAISVFNSFCRNAAEGRFPQLKDRDDLWRLLFTITERKAIRHLQHERRQKRGGGLVRGESVLDAGDGKNPGIDQLQSSPEPSPQSAYAIAENVELLLQSLGNDALRQIAIAKMEGYTNQEIAERLECSERSIKRKLKVIRTTWLEQAP